MVITIIILLILAVVSIQLVMNDNIIQKTQYATNKYRIEQEKEKAIELAYKYNLAYGKPVSDETMTKLAELVIETGVDSSKLALYYDGTTKRDENGNPITTYEERILYRYDVIMSSYKDKEQAEKEIELLENNGVYVLIGDVTADGILNNDDLTLMNNFISGDADCENEHIAYIADINKDNFLDPADELCMKYIISQTASIMDYIEK